MSFFKKEKGITLIALVVTIVILLILASISIGALMGNNGIVKQAQNAKEQTEIADEKEKIDLSTVGAVGKEPRGELKRNYFNEELTAHIGEEGKDYSLSESEELPFIVEYLDSKRSYLVDEDGNITGPLKAPEIAEPNEGTGTLDTMENGVIEIKWLIGNTNYVSDKPNSPILKTDIPNTTMKLVNYDTNGTPVYNTDYNYAENRWANAEVEIDYGNNQKVKSYFVWIPRYAYRIVYFDTPEHRDAYRNGTSTEGIIGYSDSRGIVDKEGKKVGGVASQPVLDVGEYFRVHPAFIDDSKNNYENGGWDSELPGIWVGKYETSLTKKIDGSNYSPETTMVVDKNSEYAIKVEQNQISWRNTTIDNQYISAKEYNTNLNSHMLKNSEWGAIAYLTESKYGRNGEELTENSKSSYKTANGNFINNQNQSSTGNETGIYDLRGGSDETVAIYFKEGNILEADSLINEKEGKFVTVYNGEDEKINYKVGDATYETKDFGGEKNRSNNFFDKNYSFTLTRGGFRNSIRGSNLFMYYGSGYKSEYNSFRMCLVIK